VHGILTSDLLMKNIYCYVAKEGYAARVQDTKSYQSIRFLEVFFLFKRTAHIVFLVKIFFLGGLFPLSPIITTQPGMYMNIYEETNI